MPLDPSFRSRLREALQQSRVGRPQGNPAEAASRLSTGNPADAGSVVSGEAQNNLAEAGSHILSDSSADVGSGLRELRYEPEEAERDRFDLEQSAWIADALGGCWTRDAGGACLVVDRVYAGDRAHGNAEIARYAESLACHGRALRHFDAPATPSAATLFVGLDGPSGASVDGRPPQPEVRDDDSPLLFFDLETTGLSGGAGTCAFLIGYGWFEGDNFRTRQYFLGGYGHEPALLRMAAERLDGVTLASFNGKTFDVPLVSGRYLFHRVPSPFDCLPHIDLLHPARRLWRYRPASEQAFDRDPRDPFARYFRSTALRDRFRGRCTSGASAASCTLGALEEAVLGYNRIGDVPGGEIPGRYFHYVRTGDVRPLVPVLEHNRLDLLSLAAVASLVARMLEQGPEAARNAHECLALGRLYERSGAGTRATACYEQVAGTDEASARDDPVVRREALRRLAIRHRREHRYAESAATWQRLLDGPVARANGDFEALHALAVHHEHRTKNLEAARALVIRALDCTADRRLNDALRHRLARLDRKLGERQQGSPTVAETGPDPMTEV